ncbi:unnamed protein product [Durusdinium trenchii]|uniref:Purple acid phosphatase n=1 Tax=Durusdinium trenchii TaxID=1381693 RepID=A0ABP0I8N5_9DINO
MRHLKVLVGFLHALAEHVPQQVALAAGSQVDSQVSITWLTNDTRDDPSSCDEAAVAWVSGPLTGNEEPNEGNGSIPEWRIVGSCLRYSFGAAPELYGNYTSGRIHRVVAQGLVANSEYKYTLRGDPATVKRRFRTLPSSAAPEPPAAGAVTDARFPFALGVIGDLGQTADSQDTIRHLDADPLIRLVLHAGDMSYADTDQKRWDSYGLTVEPLASRLQWMVCPGNHEIESDYYTGDNFVAYEARFAMPAVQQPKTSPSQEQMGCKHPYPTTPHSGRDCTPSAFTGHYDWGNSFYAFDAGPARVISLNSYTYTHPSSEQYNWLKEELEALAHRRSQTPWLIIMMHCPFYNSNAAHQAEGQASLMRDFHGFEDLFYKHKAAVVINGHVHAYERTHPVYQNASQDGAPTYLCVGDGGNREGHAKTYLEQPQWSAFRDGLSFGHGRLVIENISHMRWEWFRNDPTQSDLVDQANAIRRARQLANAGASTVTVESGWYQPLKARPVDDSVWILNPYKHQEPGPPQRSPMNTSLVIIGVVSAVAVALVSAIAVVHRCRRRRAEPHAECVESSAEMGSAR